MFSKNLYFFLNGNFLENILEKQLIFFLRLFYIYFNFKIRETIEDNDIVQAKKFYYSNVFHIYKSCMKKNMTNY